VGYTAEEAALIFQEATMRAIRFSCLAAIIFSTLVAATPTTQSRGVDLEQAWTDLAGAEPTSSVALLKLSETPDETTAFLKARLKPIAATSEELDRRLADLGSKDPKVWKPAFDELCYFDPRITRSLSELMDNVKDPTTRNRLVAVLCDQPADAFEGATVTLDSSDPDANNFRDSRGSWWAENRVERLNASRFGTNKAAWTRALRAIALLRHFNTPSALSIVKDLATGDADALPTKVAKGEPLP
jgi:hypothetical protein